MDRTHPFPRLVAASVLLLAIATVAWGAPRERALPERSVDAEFLRINESLPGFGGMYLDRQGKLTVVVTDRGDAAKLATVLGDDARVRRGRFEWRELDTWRGRLRAILGQRGVTTLDIDESANRLQIGVEPAAKRRVARQVRRQLGRLGIPKKAVRFSAREAMIPLQTVQDFVRPVPGGVQINFPGFLCTLGFNVELGGHCYFVTNDHCTAVSGQNDSTPYGQPLLSSPIGTEVFDPPFFTGAGCFPGSRCRYSDAAAARYDTPSDCEFGSTARTPVSNPPTIILTYDNPDRWAIVSKQLSPLLNQLVAKQGRTTGRTEGRVSATCVDTGVSGSNIVRLCQAFVDNGGGVVVQGGDSGSPVMRRRVSTSQSQLVGILWGGNGPGTEFVYSPMENVETDFGRSLPVF